MWEGNDVGPAFHIMTYPDKILYISHADIFNGNDHKSAKTQQTRPHLHGVTEYWLHIIMSAYSFI